MSKKEEDQRRVRLIGQRLLKLESENPGIVRMKANPFNLNGAMHALRSIGFKKPFMASKTQYLYDTFLSYLPATEGLLPVTLLTGNNFEPGKINCWLGNGAYGGWQGILQLGDFTTGNKMQFVSIVNCEPFLPEIIDLFDPVPAT